MHFIKVTFTLHELAYHFEFVFETRLKRLEKVIFADVHRDRKLRIRELETEGLMKGT